jgi:hypothetical protein
METPVVYFYSPTETTVNVTVEFPGGTLSEWYPSVPRTEGWVFDQEVLHWSEVRVRPGADPELPIEPGNSHYYAARATDAAPVFVGSQSEKFLFYRGVGRFQPPLATVIDPAGNVEVRGMVPGGVGGVILFENRGGKIGYTVHGTIEGAERFGMPDLDATIDALYQDLHALLVGHGLYEAEARAMLETWRDTWFEEGARLFYIVPEQIVDGLLPLAIDPVPAQVRRVFVGRMELVTPATLDTVERAIRTGDRDALAPYARFLEPIRGALVREGRMSREDWMRFDRAIRMMDAHMIASANRCR